MKIKFLGYNRKKVNQLCFTKYKKGMKRALFMFESLSQFCFILMVFTPFIAVPIFCFFLGWMIPRSQITEKSIMLVLSFVLFSLVLISYYAPQLLGMFFWGLIWFFIGLLRAKNYSKSQFWMRWLVFIVCFTIYILVYLYFFKLF